MKDGHISLTGIIFLLQITNIISNIALTIVGRDKLLKDKVDANSTEKNIYTNEFTLENERYSKEQDNGVTGSGYSSMADYVGDDDMDLSDEECSCTCSGCTPGCNIAQARMLSGEG